MDKADQAYKTIGEVAKILDLKVNKKGSLPTHIIRFWETQFKQIKPKILNSNRRYYDDKNPSVFLYRLRSVRSEQVEHSAYLKVALLKLDHKVSSNISLCFACII